ncbi:hypothetical protein A2U01_0064367, partial [Trifolium medium]|nr:hypothetical protein [Trifolium medium]
TTEKFNATLNDGAEELITPPPAWIYIVKLGFGFSGGGCIVRVSEKA